MPDQKIVADGHKRALEGARSHIAEFRRQIAEQIEAEYAERVHGAGLFRRMVLRWKLRAEIRRRVAAEIERMAPRDGLYLVDKK